jgi:hypothetical protein
MFVKALGETRFSVVINDAVDGLVGLVWVGKCSNEIVVLVADHHNSM